MITSNIITLIQKKLPKFVNAAADIQALIIDAKRPSVERIIIDIKYLNPLNPETEKKNRLFVRGT